MYEIFLTNFFFYRALLSPAMPKARDGRYCNAPRPSVCPSVCLSVCLSVTFSFDGMLFEFFMNFLNIEKNKIKNFVFSILQYFLRVSCYFQHTKKIKNWCTNKIRWKNNSSLFHIENRNPPLPPPPPPPPPPVCPSIHHV